MSCLDAFTPEEFRTAEDEFFTDLLRSRRVSPHENPQAYLLGGQSGAGKTTLHQILRERFNGDVIVINGDEYRSRHPHYRALDAEYGPDAVTHTAAWAGAMTEALIDSFSSLRYNLIIEGTLRTSAVPLKTATALKERGYLVNLALMAVKPEISLISCQIRYEQMRIAGTIPHATDPAHHRLIVDAIADNLATLEASGQFEHIELYTRARKMIHPQQGSETGSETCAADVLKETLFGAWTPEETEHYRMLQSLYQNLKAQDEV